MKVIPYDSISPPAKTCIEVTRLAVSCLVVIVGDDKTSQVSRAHHEFAVRNRSP